MSPEEREKKRNAIAAKINDQARADFKGCPDNCYMKNAIDIAKGNAYTRGSRRGHVARSDSPND
jgi:hypothetical protein